MFKILSPKMMINSEQHVTVSKNIKYKHMKKIVLIIFALFLASNVFGQNQNQNQNQRQRNRSNIPDANSPPTAQQIAKRQRDMEDRIDEYLTNFLSTLEADEFQKHIIKQNLNSFYDARIELSKTNFEHRLDRKAADKKLEEELFAELEELISESDMTKLKDMIKGVFDEKEVVKEKKKKKKKKRKKDKS